MKTIRKILIAEDELLIAKVLRMQLEALNFEVENYADGSDAFNRISEWLPDLVIMDNHLKNKSNGIEVAVKMRRSNIQSPIIFVTGNSFDNTKLLAQEIGNCAVLGKPIVFEELIQLISEYDNT